MTTNAAENATAGVPVVRGLEFREESIPPTGERIATSSVGLYSIALGRPTFTVMFRDKTSLGSFDALEQAEAAAQEHYLSCITSTLNPDFLSELDTARAEIERLKGDGWVEGVPQSPWSKEWFIAETVYGDRVVLKALPEEYTYDFKTADDTYIMARNIKRWMPFPDSEYVSPSMSSALTAAQERIAELEGALALANRKATDRLYMATAYRQMLGPKGEQVAAMWDAKGVLRQHTDWGPAARLLTGEERAQCHLDIEEAMKTARKIEPGEIDATLSPAVKESPNA